MLRRSYSACLLCPGPWSLWDYYGREWDGWGLLAQILCCLPKLLFVMG